MTDTAAVTAVATQIKSDAIPAFANKEDLSDMEKTSSTTQTEEAYPVTFTTDEERKLVRKLDWRLLPIMMVTYGLAYYDKVIIGQAVLFNMRQDLQLVNPGSRYSNASMIFNIGYIVGLPVIGLFIQRFPVGRAAATLCFCWGLTVLCTIFCKNYPGIMVQRAFLGFIEADIAPTFVSITALYYTKREQAFRATIWVAASPGTNIISPMLNYGLGSIQGPLKGWQNMYIAGGVITMSWSLVVWFRMPDSPQNANTFLTDRERGIAIERIRRINGGSKPDAVNWPQVWEALRDPNVWGLAFMAACAYFPNGVLTNFSSLIINDLGYSRIANLAVQIPKGVVGVLANIVPGYFAMKYPGLRFHIYTAAVGFAFAGSTALLLAPRVPGLLGALYGLHFFGAAAGQVHGMTASNVSGYTKRTIATCLTFLGYSLAQTIAPILFDTDKAPAYTAGFAATMSMTALGVVIAQSLRLLLRRRNLQRDKEACGLIDTSRGSQDLTDFENRNIRYAL